MSVDVIETVTTDPDVQLSLEYASDPDRLLLRAVCHWIIVNQAFPDRQLYAPAVESAIDGIATDVLVRMVRGCDDE